MKKNIFKKAILAILAVAMLTAAVAPANTYAASKTATTTKSYKPMNPDSLIKALSVYGQDTFKITYDKSSKKIISCKASQTAKNLGHTIIEKGGNLDLQGDLVPELQDPADSDQGFGESDEMQVCRTERSRPHRHRDRYL